MSGGWLAAVGATRQFSALPRVPSGVMVVHTAESVPTIVLPDSSAERVANFIRNRTDYGAYHRLGDSDSVIRMGDIDHAVWHCRITNPHSIGYSFACRTVDWPRLPAAWKTQAIDLMAHVMAADIREMQRRWGIRVPLRRITGAQARARVPGFVAHGDTDPTRRTDPGAAFPWAALFSRVAHHLGRTTAPPALTAPTAPTAPVPPPTPTTLEDPMWMLSAPNRGQALAGLGWFRQISSPTSVSVLRSKLGSTLPLVEVSDAEFDIIRHELINASSAQVAALQGEVARLAAAIGRIAVTVEVAE